MTEPRKLQDRVAIAFGSAASATPGAGSGSLAAIHDALGDITLCRDLDGIILSANRTFCEVTGVDAPEGRSCADLGIIFQPGKVAHSYDVEFTGTGFRRVFLWH